MSLLNHTRAHVASRWLKSYSARLATTTTDAHFMAIALVEARKGRGCTSPNPAVGAILVENNKVVARGYHRAAGQPHAEIECLNRSARISRSARLFITLEPCSTTGRTPACTGEIISRGIRNVVIGAMDPNLKHAGRAVSILEAAGITVRTGVLAEECGSLNEAFNKWIVTCQPLVIAKCGMSLDGRLTRPPDESKWLTSPRARAHAHQLRSEVDAILVGAETLRRDDPRLTIRGVAGAKQPLRVVLTRSGQLPRRSRLLVDRYRDRTVVLQMELREALTDLGQCNVTSVLIEGGGEVLSTALDQRLIDKVALYVAPRFTGGPVIAFGGQGAATTAEAVGIERPCYEQLGNDIYVTGALRYSV